MKRYWVGHVRGPDFAALQKKGFVTLFPTMDDYVFLEAVSHNLGLLRNESSLGVKFIRKPKSSALATVTEEELNTMRKVTRSFLQVGAKVEAVAGAAEGLQGELLELLPEERAMVRFQGLKRVFEVEVALMDLVELEKKDEPGSPPTD